MLTKALRHDIFAMILEAISHAIIMQYSMLPDYYPNILKESTKDTDPGLIIYIRNGDNFIECPSLESCTS